jgi:hypothetical protein
MGSLGPTAGPHRGHIRATNHRITADNNGQHRPTICRAQPATLLHPPQVAAIPRQSLTQKRSWELHLGITVETTENRESGSQAVQAPLPLGPCWVRAATVRYGHGRSPTVAHGSEEPQVARPSAQAAGIT